MSNITGREYIYGIAQDKNGAPYLFNVGEIVRCKDCKHSHMTSDGYCRYCDELDAEGCAWYFEGDFFCAYGERREP